MSLRIDFKIDPLDKHFPGADDWMWNYCIFLGKYTDANGKNYDLGLHIETYNDGTRSFCDATVDDNEPGSYSSGEISQMMWELTDEKSPHKETKREVYRRARALGIIDF